MNHPDRQLRRPLGKTDATHAQVAVARATLLFLRHGQVGYSCIRAGTYSARRSVVGLMCVQPCLLAVTHLFRPNAGIPVASPVVPLY